MTLSEWLEIKTNASRLESCERVLTRFRATADADPEFTAGVGTAVWALLASDPGEDAATLLTDMRIRSGALGRNQLDELSTRLLEITQDKSRTQSEAGILVSSWLRMIRLGLGVASGNHRALHVTRAYENTFVSLGRL